MSVQTELEITGNSPIHFNALNQRSPGMASIALAELGTSSTVEATTSPITTAKHNAMTICTTGFVRRCHHGLLLLEAGISGAPVLVPGSGAGVDSFCLRADGSKSRARLSGAVWSTSGSWVVLEVGRETLLSSSAAGCCASTSLSIDGHSTVVSLPGKLLVLFAMHSLVSRTLRNGRCRLSGKIGRKRLAP